MAKKQRDFSDSELLSFALKDVKPLPGRAIKTDMNLNTRITTVSKNTLDRGTSNKKIKNTGDFQQILHGETPELDKTAARKLKRGKMQIDARLDLHGYNQEKAFRALSDFISNSVQSNKRCVLVITGKGLHYGKDKEPRVGVLRKMVPVWLNESPNRSRIISFSYAKPSDGGVGALYILLKRPRIGLGK